MTREAGNWYPTRTSDQYEALRIAFDKIYDLQGRMQTNAPLASQAPGGMSVTVLVTGGFTAGSNSGTVYHNMTFRNGLLVGIS